MKTCSRPVLRDTRGMSAIEFALVAPIFIFLLVAGADALRFYFIVDGIDIVASTVAELMSEHPTNSITYQDIQFYRDSSILAYPGLLKSSYRNNVAWAKSISISQASVDFGPAQTGCGTACVYTPRMVWSGGPAARSCLIPPLAARDDDPPSPLTLPAHIYGPGSSIVIDVVYPYKPIFSSRIFPSFNIKRSYYIAPRFNSIIKYQSIPGDDYTTIACPGYS